MRKLIFILALLLVVGCKRCDQEVCCNKILYTSTTGELVPIYSAEAFGAKIIDHLYKDGQGIIKFDGEVTMFADHAFYKCDHLKSVTIPKHTSIIGKRAFYECSNLESIEGLNSVTLIDDYAFTGCENLGEITVGDGVKSIGIGAFIKCSKLKSVTLPNTLTHIGGSAFSDCSALTTIELGNALTSLGSQAFFNCSTIECITLPSTITTIGSMAFAFCTNLTTLYCKSPHPPTVDMLYMLFYESSKLSKIYVPRGCSHLYLEDSEWSSYAELIEEYDFE